MNHEQAINEHWRTQLLRAIEAREAKAKAMDQNAEADKARWGAIALREFLEGMK